MCTYRNHKDSSSFFIGAVVCSSGHLKSHYRENRVNNGRDNPALKVTFLFINLAVIIRFVTTKHKMKWSRFCLPTPARGILTTSL
jgi:hypothetical protein